MCETEGQLVAPPVLGDMHFKVTSASSSNRDSAVSLRCACSHVSDKVSVCSGIRDGPIILASSEFPPGGIIGGETTLISSFQFIPDPAFELEGALPQVGSLLPTSFDGSLSITAHPQLR